MFPQGSSTDPDGPRRRPSVHCNTGCKSHLDIQSKSRLLYYVSLHYADINDTMMYITGKNLGHTWIHLICGFKKSNA